MKHTLYGALLLAALAGLGAPSFAADEENTKAALPFAAAVKQSGKWGAVGSDGRVIVPAEYDAVALSLTADDNARAADLESMEGREDLIEVRKGTLRGFYDRTGRVVIPVSYESRSAWTEDAVAVQAKKKEIAFWKKDGTQLSEAVYSEASDFHDGAAVVKEDGKYGYLRIDGTKLPAVHGAARYFKDGLAPVKDKKWGVIDETGEYVVPPTYDDAGPCYSDGLLAVKKNDKWGFIDTKGEVAVPLIYRAVHPLFEDGMTAVQDEEKLWGFLNNKGEVTAEPVFREVLTPFSEGLAGVLTKDGKAYAREDGSIAFNADFDRIFAFEDGLAEYREGTIIRRRVRPSISIGWGWGWGWGHHRHHRPWGWGWGGPVFGPWWYDPWYAPSVIDSEEKRGYIDTEGRIIASASLDHVYPATDKGLLVFNDGRYGWIDRTGQYTIHTEYRALIPLLENDIVLARNEDKAWGLLDFSGETVAPFEFSELKSLSGAGALAYKKDGKWGLLAADGTLLTEALYSDIGTLSDDRIPARAKGGWLYLDTEGHEVITFEEKADEALPFKDGFAGVKIKGKWGIIDTAGHFTVDPAYENYSAL